MPGPQGCPARYPGPDGEKGDPGPDGKRGVQGNPGHVGNQGSPGEFGIGVQGNPGQDGSQGAQGNPGQNGSQGSQGNPGQNGNQGSQGSQGNPGKDGSQGAQGNPGQNGAQGAQGNPGKDGSQGAQGNPGQIGAQGAQGDPGQVGAQGAQGSPGQDGQNLIKLASNFVDLFSTDLGTDTSGFLTTWNSDPFTISDYSTTIRTMVLYLAVTLEVTPKVGPVVFVPEVIVSIRTNVSGLFNEDIYLPTTLQVSPAVLPPHSQSPIWLCTGSQLLYTSSLPSVATPITFSIYVRLNTTSPTNFDISNSDQSYQSIYLTALYE